MTKDEVINEYFNWLCELICKERYSKTISYRKLLMKLHDIDFVYVIKKDKSRASDGEDLRYRFALNYEEFDYIIDCLDRPCSVLEMLVALAVRCEETIMDDPQIGNRTGQWFWSMITSLGLGYMTDNRFDGRTVDEVIDRLLYREYEPNGRGGLFTIKNCTEDLRHVEIWTIMLWYLDSLICNNI